MKGCERLLCSQLTKSRQDQVKATHHAPGLRSTQHNNTHPHPLTHPSLPLPIVKCQWDIHLQVIVWIKLIKDKHKDKGKDLFKIKSKECTKIGINITTRAVESESLKVRKSLKIGKNQIKSENSDLISY